MTDHGGAASPRTEADIIDKALDDAGCSRARDYMAQAESIVTALHKAGYRVAAQEAPAQEGLRAAEGVVAEMLAAESALDQARDRLKRATDTLGGILRATPPTPAEPPSLTRFAAMVEEMDRAEARPPEGLDPDRLAIAMHRSQEWCDGTEDFDWRTQDEVADDATAIVIHGAAARTVAAEYARLSAGGATKP